MKFVLVATLLVLAALPTSNATDGEKCVELTSDCTPRNNCRNVGLGVSLTQIVEIRDGKCCLKVIGGRTECPKPAKSFGRAGGRASGRQLGKTSRSLVNAE